MYSFSHHDPVTTVGSRNQIYENRETVHCDLRFMSSLNNEVCCSFNLNQVSGRVVVVPGSEMNRSTEDRSPKGTSQCFTDVVEVVVVNGLRQKLVPVRSHSTRGEKFSLFSPNRVFEG